MHRERRERVAKEGRIHGKTTVLGMLQRGGKVRAAVIPDRTKPVMQEHVRENVDAGTTLFSDEHASHWRMDEEYKHEVSIHANAYVAGNVHANGLENFWSLLKRGLHGTYISVEPFHLFRYIDEQAFRFNNRGPMNDSQRFSYVMRKIVGKRLTYTELIGMEGETSAQEEVEPF